MTVPLDLPRWMKDALLLNDYVSTVYVNPHNNADYEFRENTDEIYCDPYSGGGDESNRVFEEHHSVSHYPLVSTRKRKRTVLYPGEETKTSIPTVPFKRTKRSRQPNERMSKLSFIRYFINTSNLSPTEKMISSVYDSLDGCEINDRVLEVVLGALEFVYGKNLNNTMTKGCERRTKRFKCQVKYILNGIGGGNLYSKE